MDKYKPPDNKISDRKQFIVLPSIMIKRRNLVESTCLPEHLGKWSIEGASSILDGKNVEL
jgi:hypothetical protein